MIIGITGPECSGKDTAADYLKRKGFIPFSLSDEIRAECKIRELPTDTPTLVRLANEMREQYGADILARRAYAKLEPNKNYVATSIRNPGELEYLRAQDNFLLCFLTADPRTLYARHLARHGRSKHPTFESFLAEQRAQESNDPLKQQFHLILLKADHIIQNDGDINTLYRSLDVFLAKYGLKPNNP